MQKLKKYTFKSKVLALFSLLFVLLFSSCEDVVNLDLETGEAKIVIDAEIIWKKGTSGNEQTIKISKMASYYSTVTPKVSGAQVRVENSDGTVFTFNETQPGLYVCTDFIPVLNMDYTLHVQAEGQSFTAVEKLMPVTPIKRVEQGLVLEGDKDLIELTFYYDDPANEVNYNLSDFKSDFLLYPEYNLMDDDFFNGNEINIRFSHEDMKAGNVVDITNRGISGNFYNYMNLILEASNANPFATPPANIRGNIVNANDATNFALGYFRLCEADKVSYTVK
ncbi:MAG: DUF4249 family protein [Flavobacterium sp.]